MTWGPIHKDEKENMDTIYLQHYVINAGGRSENLGVHVVLKSIPTTISKIRIYATPLFDNYGMSMNYFYI